MKKKIKIRRMQENPNFDNLIAKFFGVLNKVFDYDV